jgi:aspartate/methionine/tyrosine aminotransferase
MFDRTKDLKLSLIKQMELRAAAYPDVISLAQGIPSFDTPACIKGRAERALNRGAAAKYSLAPGLPELRELIEISLAQENIYYDWQKEIIVTAGSIEGLTAAILAITSPGDEIIVPEPSYTSYSEVIKLAGCRVVYSPLEEDQGWLINLKKLEQAITPKSKAILYANPNNPTGTIYTKQQLLALADLAVNHNLYLIADEVYKDFVYQIRQKDSPALPLFSLAQLAKLRNRVIRLFSFSKSYAMTGWRVGYLHSDESITREILKIHDSLVTCAPVISQYAAMAALEMGDNEIRQFIASYAARKNLICRRLNKLNRYFHFIEPTSAYYVFPKILPSNKTMAGESGKVDSWQFATRLLEQAQVASVPGLAFGPSGEGHLRFSFGRKETDISQAFDRIENYFFN